jgi:hypothetical protein
MKTLEVIAGIATGAVFCVWIGYLAVRLLGNARANKDAYDRDSERHVMPKK